MALMSWISQISIGNDLAMILLTTRAEQTTTSHVNSIIIWLRQQNMQLLQL